MQSDAFGNVVELHTEGAPGSTFPGEDEGHAAWQRGAPVFQGRRVGLIA